MWQKGLAKAIFLKFQDDIRSRYIEIRKDRLGSMFPAELLLDVGLLDELHHLTFLLSEFDFEMVRDVLLVEVENLMDEVEAIR